MNKEELERVVAEIPQELKRRLYAMLALEGRTFLEWLIEQIQEETKENGENKERPEAKIALAA